MHTISNAVAPVEAQELYLQDWDSWHPVTVTGITYMLLTYVDIYFNIYYATILLNICREQHI